jgi:general secretion pathway protein F
LPVFAYQARDDAGRRKRGRSEAASAGALIRALQRGGLVVLEVSAADQEALGSSRRGASTRNVLEFARACAALLGAGMPVARALATSSLVVPTDLARVIESVRERVERGASLAEALSDHPAVFSPVFTGVVRAGEKSGDLRGAFERLTRRLEREHELRSRLISLSIYPVLLALAGGAAVVVLVTFVLPRFTDLLTGSGAALPWSTAALLGISGFARSHVWLLASTFALAPALAVAGSTTPAGKRSIIRLALALPFVGGLWRERLAGMFAGMVGVMTAGGAPLLRALDDTSECMSDPLGREEVRRIRSRVREGASLRQAVAEGGLFPPLLERLIAVGEEAARLSDFLLEAAALFERRTERTMERFVALVEPAMILFFGGIVAFIALALLQGIYGINAGSFR